MSPSQLTYEELLHRYAESEREREESERKREESERKREEAEHQLEEEKQRQRPLSFLEALELWHHLFSRPPVYFRHLQIKPSHLTRPTGRMHPRQLRHWSDFHALHRAAFQDIGQAFHQLHVQSHQHYQTSADEFMPSVLLRNEDDLVSYTQRTVEEMVIALWRRTNTTLHFKNCTEHPLDDLSNRVSMMTTDDDADDRPSRPSTPKPRRRFDKLVFLDDDKKERPIFVVEYKAADKLTPGLVGNSLRDMDLHQIIHRDRLSTDPEQRQRETNEEAMCAVLTQTFDYMIDQGVSYGYVTGGEAYIFLSFVPEDPSILYYDWVNIQAAAGTGASFEHRLTAVGLVTAFARLAALRGQALGDRWSSWARRRLPVWEIDDDVILANVTPSPAAKPSARPSSPLYSGKAKPNLELPPRQTRAMTKLAECKAEAGASSGSPQEPSDDDDEVTSRPKPSASRPTRSRGNQLTRSDPRRGRQENDKQRSAGSYCTQRCLLGLVRGLPLDPGCPNFDAHRRTPDPHRHAIDHVGLTQRLEDQLREDREDQGFESLNRSGWAGALFRVTLLSHGYTFVAKGTVRRLIPVLRKEARIYRHLQEIQGAAVPIYLGSIDLPRRFWLTTAVAITHVLMLSWGGEEAWRCGIEKKRLEWETRRTVKEVERLGVSQGDVRPSNLLWNEELRRVLLIDFEFGKMAQRTKEKRALKEIDDNIGQPRTKMGRKEADLTVS